MEGVTFIMTYLDSLDPAVPETRNLQISQLMSQSVLLLKPVCFATEKPSSIQGLEQ